MKIGYIIYIVLFCLKMSYKFFFQFLLHHWMGITSFDDFDMGNSNGLYHESYTLLVWLQSYIILLDCWRSKIIPDCGNYIHSYYYSVLSVVFLLLFLVKYTSNLKFLQVNLLFLLNILRVLLTKLKNNSSSETMKVR